LEAELIISGSNPPALEGDDEHTLPKRIRLETQGDSQLECLQTIVPLSAALMGLVDPELRNETLSIKSMKGVMTESLSGGQRVSGDMGAGQPVAIDEEEIIWKVEALFSKGGKEEESDTL